MDDSLSGVIIFEKDNNDDVLLTWSYPLIEPNELNNIAKQRSLLAEENIPTQFSYSKYKNTWIYIFTDSNTGNKIKRATVFSICLFTSTFHPEKYGQLAKLLSLQYNKTGSPVAVLDKYLAALGGFLPTTEFDPSTFEQSQAFLASSIRDVIGLFDEEVIQIWNAMIMKKRIVVYSEKLGPLLKVIRAFPLFVLHRQDWDVLRPFVTVNDVELNDLKETGVFVAGFTDNTITRYPNMYDLFVNVSERRIEISEHASEDFVLSSFHKDLTTYLTSSLENKSITDQTIVKELMSKTKNLLSKLEGLKENNENGEGYVTFEGLQHKKLPSGMDKFLFHVASAEGMTQHS